ncbi:MAG: efflux RND transporter periplasmic adaptor subunit [Polyangiaceae bacterium]
MIRRLSALSMMLVLSGSLVFAACGERERTSTSASATDNPQSALCEHGLAEELCPKCHPELATIYQSKGDWCDEHGMPESFCPICHPEAGGRPVAKKAGGDAPVKKAAGPATKAPKDKTKVALKAAIADAAGLETVKAVKAPPKTAIRFPARIVYDATRTAEITASAGGIVRSVAVDLGAAVKVGDVLATVDSAEVGVGRTRLAAAYKRVSLAEDRLARLRFLEKDGIVSRNERVDAELALDAANADVAALSAELGLSGALTGSGTSYVLKSPIAGVIVKRSAAFGMLVDNKEALFQVVDPTQLWAELDIPEASAAALLPGAEVALEFPALPAETFAGTVSAVLPEVDPHTRTVTARVAVKNEHVRLRANMFGEAAVLGDTPAEGVTVPRGSIQSVENQRFVFVRKTADLFELRHVTVGARDGASVLLVSGVAAGEEVVTTGSFLLKTETLKDSIGAGCCADD